MASLVRRALGRARHHLRTRIEARRAPFYLVAAAGQPNFGDEFITRSWLDWLAEHHPRREVWLDCMEPGRAAHLFRDAHPRLKTTNTLWQTVHTDSPEDVVESAARMERLIRELGSPKMDFGLRDLRRMRSVHLLGGGYMNTIWPRNLAIIGAMTALKKHFGVPIFATGQGLLPHDGPSRKWLRDQLAQFDYAEARDAGSADIFGIAKGTDDAFLAFANKRRIYAPRAGLPPSMVLIQGDMIADTRDAEVLRHIKDFVDEFGGDEVVGFAEGIPPEDARFAGQLPGTSTEFFPFMRIWEDGFPAYEGQTWLTSRFHFHLLAAAAGARGTVIDARPGYYNVKHDLLGDLGTGWSLENDAENLTAPSSSKVFPQTARRLGARKAELAKYLYGR